MDKKSQKKKDREAKKRLQRKQSSRSPFEKLGAPPQNLRALINADWDEQGVADILIRRDLPGGLLAIGWFKVSLDVAGLLLAQGQLDATEQDWSDAVADYAKAGKMVPAPLPLIRHLIETGAALASTNGLRLPEKWDKWAHIYGTGPHLPPGLPTDEHPLFDPGYYGPLSELFPRLIGYTPEAFLARTDITVNPQDDLGLLPESAKKPDIVLDDETFKKDEEDEAEIWRRLGESPHPDLDNAVNLHFQAALAALHDTTSDPNLRYTDSPLYKAALEKAINTLPPDRQQGIRLALAQHSRYVDTKLAFYRLNSDPDRDPDPDPTDKP